MICPFCLHKMSCSVCSHCGKGFARHFVGADSDYKVAEWKDLELLYPLLWFDWLGRKIVDSAFDPSQTKDPQEKRRMLAAVAKQLNTVIETCSAVPQADRTGWVQFTQAFIPWFNKGSDDSFFGGSSADNEQANSFQDQLRGWQEEISKYCNIGMPFLPKSAPTLSQLGHETLETAGKYFDTVKTIVLVGLVGMVVIFVVLGRSNVQRAFTKVLPR